jgi:hypothetical protein
MTGPEHYTRAEKFAALTARLLTEEVYGNAADRDQRAAAAATLAQTHATLALAAAHVSTYTTDPVLIDWTEAVS